MSVNALLLLLVLAAPTGQQWSEKRGVGLFVPQTWKILKRDEGDKVFVFEGPKLGPGIPHAELRYIGPAPGMPLADLAKTLRKKVEARPGWEVVSQTEKDIDGFPAVRFGVRFRTGEGDGARGRARFTVVRLDGHFYVLELSASNRNFPGATFDRIEQSLKIKWRKHTLPGGLTIEAPASWERLANGLKSGAVELRFQAGVAGLDGPPEAKPGPKMVFLGKARASLQAENDERGLAMRATHGERWLAFAIGPLPGWKDEVAIVARVLKTARLPKPPVPPPPK